jgi:hypothetical protein
MKFEIKIKTAKATTVITAICASADEAWDTAWGIAGEQPASIGVKVLA